MKIINLVENTEGSAHCGAEHGLSYYIETKKHRILMDTGASDLFMKNAEKLGVDLTKVDILVLRRRHSAIFMPTTGKRDTAISGLTRR